MLHFPHGPILLHFQIPVENFVCVPMKYAYVYM